MDTLPNDIIELIYYRLHRLYMADVREELCGSDETFFWLQEEWESDISYSCTSSDNDSSTEED